METAPDPVRSARQRASATRRWASVPPEARTANLAAAQRVGSRKRTAAFELLRLAEGAIVAAGGRVEWDRGES